MSDQNWKALHEYREQMIRHLSREFLGRLDLEQYSAAKETDSPIEAMLSTALRMAFILDYRCSGLDTVGRHDPAKENWKKRLKGGNPVLVSQYHLDGKRYDFALFVSSLSLPLLIECDGHDFHERTKEQAAKDRSRDRETMAKGYRVIRFTGSEIYADPVKCALEVIEHHWDFMRMEDFE